MNLGSPRRSSRLKLLAFALCGAAATAFASDDPSPALTVPMMTAAKTPRAPKIDGRLAENEWRFAASAAGFLNLAANLTDREEQVRVEFLRGWPASRFGFRDVMTGEHVAAEGSRVAVHVDSRSLRLLRQ